MPEGERRPQCCFTDNAPGTYVGVVDVRLIEKHKYT